ncbi:DUF2309 domain-containing protein [Limnobacter humi]|uniref:Probable inorganic carbon transporter subunit DabA n=1 Tax=Limnobacter humi TaxID=1778671 RepID=A0ABT1WHU0_9BURK|nr:DUF2309 domain-containing protein [Limnobacter humi]MCQ8896601.1 DUF2309 domain-containing protein [Limnobacter humi]
MNTITDPTQLYASYFAQQGWTDTEQQALDEAVQRACGAIAPTWPLDQAIAVNPHWQRIGRPLREVAARMAVLAGIRVLPSRVEIHKAWQAERIVLADLQWAIAHTDPDSEMPLDAQQCLDMLGHQPLDVAQLPLLIDVLDDDPLRHTRLSWREAISHQVSQTCAAYFDRQQADWQPERSGGLYAFWRETLTHDHGIGVLMGLPHMGRSLSALPATWQDAERWVVQRLGLPKAVWADYLESVLLTVQGWASWCAYLGWQAGLKGEQDPHLRELLAIRLAWGVILLECKHDAATERAFAALKADWLHAPERIQAAQQALWVDEVWQTAMDKAYQRGLVRTLSTHPAHGVSPVAVQAAFCIDVRSEPFRRALEQQNPAIQTLGFAGFFGLPVAYNPLGSTLQRPQLPGLLAPTLCVSDEIEYPQSTPDNIRKSTEQAGQARQRGLQRLAQWGAASRWPGAAYSYVEAAGVGYLGKLGRWLRPSDAARQSDDLIGLPSRYRAYCRPGLQTMDSVAQVDLAARILTAMGLTQQLAPWVLLVGHGSQTSNNAHAAALDCGACCGQSGEVNARALARLLNRADVRQGLAQRGLPIPANTRFVGALHNTTTDELQAFDLDLLPPEALAEWQRVQADFQAAGDVVRRQRAARLGLPTDAPAQSLLQRFRRRANDGAQTRPEWGLAGNAAFIMAPRSRTRGLDLQGRVFLHDYDPVQDLDRSLLELLMTAPMLVTHWINWQYHASTCDPQRLGSGNKLLHNVVGGHIGVFEGNGGDLRIGLSTQSLHDGQRWVHDPVRLTVVIDAPAEAIDAILYKHAVVSQLVDNGWLHLWRFAGSSGLEMRVGQSWQVVG